MFALSLCVWQMFLVQKMCVIKKKKLNLNKNKKLFQSLFIESRTYWCIYMKHTAAFYDIYALYICHVENLQKKL